MKGNNMNTQTIEAPTITRHPDYPGGTGLWGRHLGTVTIDGTPWVTSFELEMVLNSRSATEPGLWYEHPRSWITCTEYGREAIYVAVTLADAIDIARRTRSKKAGAVFLDWVANKYGATI